MPHSIKFSLANGDITTYKGDVVVLKYAQSFHGADLAVARALVQQNINIKDLEAPIGGYRFVETQGGIAAPYALCIGVKSLWTFRYAELLEFSATVFSILAEQAPDARHVLMTIHGMGYGLDEAETLLAQFKGCLTAIETRSLPPNLEKITIVERNSGRVERSQAVLDNYAQTVQNVMYQDHGSYLLHDVL